MAVKKTKTPRQALLEDGFHIFPEVLSRDEVRLLQETSNRLLAVNSLGVNS